MSRYVPYHAESQVFAKQLCRGISDPLERFKMVCDYLNRTVAYDYVRAVQLAKLKGQYPDVKRVWDRRIGICMDIAALATGMFRAVGIKCYYCVGHADSNYHAWVQAYIGKQMHLYDHNGKAKKYIVERAY